MLWGGQKIWIRFIRSKRPHCIVSELLPPLEGQFRPLDDGGRRDKRTRVVSPVVTWGNDVRWEWCVETEVLTREFQGEQSLHYAEREMIVESCQVVE